MIQVRIRPHHVFDIVSWSFEGRPRLVTLADFVLTCRAKLPFRGYIEVLGPKMCFIFNTYVFIVSLDRFRCQLGTLTHFAFRPFSGVGDVVSFRHAIPISLLFDQYTKQLFARVLFYSELSGGHVVDTVNKFLRNRIINLKGYRFREYLTLDFSQLGQILT